MFKEIETKRLWLKNITDEDEQFILEQFSNEDVNRYLYDAEPMKKLSEAQELIAFYTSPEPRGQHRWILVRKTDGAKLGTCGFHCWNREEHSIETGYDLKKEYQGNGYMTEAMEAIIEFAEKVLDVTAIDAHIADANEKSISMIKKLGFEFFGKTENYCFHGKNYLHYVFTKRRERLEYRELLPEEAERISEIDATNYIKNVWRFDENTQEYRLVEINWTDTELPNGFEWHLNRLKETLSNGGGTFGCFDRDVLVGYATVDKQLFGKKARYALLDQLFVSNNQRGKGIGKSLFLMCAAQAKEYGAEKLFLCAGSAENTIAFYKKLGCKPAVERNERLYEEDPRDIQLEYIC